MTKLVNIFRVFLFAGGFGIAVCLNVIGIDMTAGNLFVEYFIFWMLAIFMIAASFILNHEDPGIIYSTGTRLYDSQFLPVNYDLGTKARQQTMDDAVGDGKFSLPRGAVFEVRSKKAPVSLFQVKQVKDWGIYWICVSDKDNGSFQLFRNSVDCGVTHKDGYMLLARVRA